MNKYFEFSAIDKKLWIGIGAVSGIVIVLLSLFTTTSLFYWLVRILVTILIMFVPGYIITKLFFDKLVFTEYPVVDKFIVSFFFSIATVQTLYFLTTYLRTYGLNIDEDIISSDKIALVLALLVIGAAFGIKAYLIRKNQPAS
jgi:uncharacterized membrane protein